LEKLRKAETDEEKHAARKELASALGDEFDQHLEDQAEELKRLEARLEKLRGQWEKRRDAKDELVELRLQTLENDVNGLGWPAGGPGVWHGDHGAMHLPPMGAEPFMFQGALAPSPADVPPVPGPQAVYSFSLDTEDENSAELMLEVDEDDSEDEGDEGEDDEEDDDDSVRFLRSRTPQPER
jgi:hypothetical protein